MRLEIGPSTSDLRVFLRDGTEITDEFRAEDILLVMEAGHPQPLTLQLSLRPEHATILAGRVEVQILPSLNPPRRKPFRHRFGEWLQR